MKNKKKMCFGVIIGTRAYFNSELAKDVRKQLLETLTKEGYDYVILPEDATPTGSSSIETREDGLKCAKLFRENRDRIDGIIVSLPNFGFEIGIINAISVADLNVPVLVQACDDENDKVDLDSRRDAFCGKISVCNNLYQYGIPFTDTTLHTYSIYSDLLAADINKFAAICRVVNGLRHARIGAIGTRPAGFQTVRASEKLLQASGITVVPVDLSEILSAARKIEDADETLQAKLKEIRQYAAVPEQYNDKLILQAKFGVAVEQWMEANEIDAVAIQCWDSLEQNYGCAACVTMSMLSEKLIPAFSSLPSGFKICAFLLSRNCPSRICQSFSFKAGASTGNKISTRRSRFLGIQSALATVYTSGLAMHFQSNNTRACSQEVFRRSNARRYSRSRPECRPSAKQIPRTISSILTPAASSPRTAPR